MNKYSLITICTFVNNMIDVTIKLFFIWFTHYILFYWFITW